MIKYIKNSLKFYYSKFHDLYGKSGVAAAAAVFLKMILFYLMIGTVTNFVPVLIISYIFIYLLFSSIKNKWIPASIFTVFSFLMVCDVTYSSFFNRYLSVNMIGAAAFIGDITASIMEVFRPVFLLLLVDVILIFICLIKLRKRTNLKEAEKTIIATEPKLDEEFFALLDEADTPEDQWVLPEGQKKVLPRRRKRNRKKKSFRKWILSHIKPLSTLVLILLLLTNVTGSSFVRSVSNQEIITYHLKDVAMKAFRYVDGNSLSAFSDTYGQERIGPIFGVAKGRNLIIIQLESFQNFVIGLSYNGQEVTPNLNRLLEENTAYFDNYYQQVGSGNTSDAEFATNNSIYGSLMSYTYKLYGSKNYFRGLPALLSEEGYDTAVFHAHENKNFWSRKSSYPNLGFNTYYGGLTNREGDGIYKMEKWMGWGLTDDYFFKQTSDFMTELKQPFYSFIITLSNHHPYEMLDEYQFLKILPEDKGTIVGNYLNSAAFADYTLGLFFDELKAKGLYDNSIIALYGDHVAMTHSEEIDASMEKLLGRPYDFDTMMNIPLIITIPNSNTDIRQTISTAGGQLDFLPTIAYLMGFDKLDTIYLGHNLFTIREGFVAEQTYMTKGSYFKNDMAYEMARDGVFEHGRAWNLKTGEAIPLSECYKDYVRSMNIVNTSEYVLRSDAIRKIFLDGEDARTAFNAQIARPHPDTIGLAGAPGQAYANSVDAIEYSYEYGNRDIRVNINWTKDSEPVGINSLTGETEMTWKELVDWMERHADTTIIVSIQRSGDYFMRFMSEHSPAVADRIILELPELSEYTGKHDAIINISGLSHNVSEISDFIGLNKVWAILMSKEDAEGRFASLLDLKTTVYIIGEKDGFITKAD